MLAAFVERNQGERNEHLQSNRSVPGQDDHVTSCCSFLTNRSSQSEIVLGRLIRWWHPAESWPSADPPSPQQQRALRSGMK